MIYFLHEGHCEIEANVRSETASIINVERKREIAFMLAIRTLSAHEDETI